jgi:hypothetical protein
MKSQKNRIVLNGNRRNATIALCSTGFVAIQSFRAAFSNATRNPHWLISLEPIALPTWALAVVNASFYLCIVWKMAIFFRNAQREERLVIGGWFGVFFLIPMQHLVSIRGANAIQWLKATGLATAFVAAAYILVKSPANTEGVTRATKQRFLIFLFLVLVSFVIGALLYFVPR